MHCGAPHLFEWGCFRAFYLDLPNTFGGVQPLRDGSTTATALRAKRNGTCPVFHHPAWLRMLAEGAILFMTKKPSQVTPLWLGCACGSDRPIKAGSCAQFLSHSGVISVPGALHREFMLSGGRHLAGEAVSICDFQPISCQGRLG